jgi:hypothetical protein
MQLLLAFENNHSRGDSAPEADVAAAQTKQFFVSWCLCVSSPL